MSVFFYIGGRRIENVSSYSHLGHIISCKCDDKDDMLQRRNHFIGQANNVLCIFKALDMRVKIKLFNSYCSSMYGSELWSLDDDVLQDFCCSWRSALRRLLNLPYNTHCFLLPLLTGTLPVFDEICKRSARFINSCLHSRCHLVRSIAQHSIVHGDYYSPLGRNLRFCCRRFDWRWEDFVSGCVSLNNDYFRNFCMNTISVAQFQTASLADELLSLREGFAAFDCGTFFTKNDIDVLLNAVCTE